MEKKIGEIFECNGEWYQCVKSDGTCNGCVGKFQPYSFCNGFGECVGKIFKKLEKLGEPYAHHGVIVQNYRIRATPVIMPNEPYMYFNAISNTIAIEIKQNKENMEIDKVVMNIDDRDYLLDRLDAILHDTHCQQYKDEVCEALSKYIVTRNTSDLKPFDLHSAKAGKPVCTRGGRKARIIYFDAKGDYPIVALIETGNGEKVVQYMIDGHCTNIISQCYDDLMMLPEKKEGWVNVYKGLDGVTFSKHPYTSKDEAIKNAGIVFGRIDTIKVSWEE